MPHPDENQLFFCVDTKLEIDPGVFASTSNVKFRRYPSSCSRIGTCGRTDTHDYPATRMTPVRTTRLQNDSGSSSVVKNSRQTLRFFNRALWYTPAIKTNKMHTFYINVNLIIVSSACFEHPSVPPQEDLYRVIKKSLCTWWLQYRSQVQHPSHRPDYLYGCMKEIP